MKKYFLVLMICIAGITSFAFTRYYHKDTDPWTQNELMNPADLAKIINDAKVAKPIIYSIGFEGGIKGSIAFGPVNDKVNLDKFTSAIVKHPKNSNIVVYCGCCPFAHCPNIRPAVKLLKEMAFTNFKLLNLEHNMKVDWIDKGYPMNN